MGKIMHFFRYNAKNSTKNNKCSEKILNTRPTLGNYPTAFSSQAD